MGLFADDDKQDQRLDALESHVRALTETVHRLQIDTSELQLLILALGWMGEATSPNLVVRFFEIQLLRLTGFTPEIVDCVECRETLEPGDYFFSPAAGGVLCESCRVASDEVLVPISLNTMKVLRFLTRERRYENIDALEVSPAIVSNIERVTRNYIRFILERDLKSAEFMNLVSRA